MDEVTGTSVVSTAETAVTTIEEVAVETSVTSTDAESEVEEVETTPTTYYCDDDCVLNGMVGINQLGINAQPLADVINANTSEVKELKTVGIYILVFIILVVVWRFFSNLLGSMFAVR